jgi:hypothetical protein
VIEKGTLVYVESRDEGSSLSVDVAAGATLLPVERTADFTGTKLSVAGVTYTYTDVTDAGITISSALAADATAGDPVLSLNDAGEVESEWTAWVRLSEDDPEPIPALIETNNRGYFRLGDADAGALVEVESIGEGYRVRSRVVDPATFDGTLIDPDTLPKMGQTVDVVAPPTDPDEIALYPEGFGWWQVDENDEVVGFWRLEAGAWVPTSVVTVDALKANNALIEALTGTTITGATIQTRADQKRGVKLGTVDGIEGLFVYNESGIPFLKAVPAEELAVIAGEVKATTTTVTEGASLGGTTEITRHPDGSAGAVRLTAYTTAPKSAPTVTQGYDTVQFDDDGLWNVRLGWATDGTSWFTTRVGTGGASYLEKWNAAGAKVGSVSLSSPGYPRGVAYGGGKLYVLAEDSGGNWNVWRHDPATLAFEISNTWTGSVSFLFPAISYDSAAGEIVIAQSNSSNSDKVRIRRYTMSTTPGAALVASATAAVDSSFGYANGLAGVYYGSADFGANRYVFVNYDDGNRYRAIDTTGAATTDDDWQSGMTAKVGFTWTGSAFVSMDSSGVMRTYTAQDKGTALGHANLTKWVANTLANATYETDRSPRAKVTINKRAKVFVSTSAINTGGTNAPDRVKVYVGQGSTDPARTSMWKQTDPGVGVTSTDYASLATSGTNPPATNGFVAAGGTVQRVELADGTVFIDGLGAGSLGTGTFRTSVDTRVVGTDTWHTVGGAGEPAFTNTWTNRGAVGHPPVSFRKNGNGDVRLRGHLAVGGASGTSAFTLPVGWRPDYEIGRIVVGASQLGTPAYLDILANGTCEIRYPAGTTYVSLNGVTFSTA